nr:hypothetical protein HK105_000318 [Polyrhizophydium stewartii]
MPLDPQLASATKFNPSYTYGLQRAEVLGALINGVSLLALCFSITIEAIQRFFVPVVLRNPLLVVITGSAGLLMNICGLFLFHAEIVLVAERMRHSVEAIEREDEIDGCPSSLAAGMQAVDAVDPAVDGTTASHEGSHDHDHDHSHGHDHGHEHSKVVSRKSSRALSTTHSHEHDHSHDHDHGHSHGHAHGHGDMNMHGVFLHVLGDALGSIGVIVSTLIIIYAEGDWKYYMDPVMSLIITFLIVWSTIPLCRSACFILMQSVPSSMRIDTLRSAIKAVPGVISIHELHVWQLSDSKAIASVHVLVSDPADLTDGPAPPPYMEIAANIKRKLHSHGIHSTTIQPEFVRTSLTDAPSPNESEDATERDCFLSCAEASCADQRCCPPPRVGSSDGSAGGMASS